jgi:tRNA pseudouridine13 synthase
VQRVSLKRGNKTVEDVWKLANGRKPIQDNLSQRGERGVRIADLTYRKSSLELGMLKGNAFLITLRYVHVVVLTPASRLDVVLSRNVQVDSAETLDRALESMKHKGFINYYGDCKCLSSTAALISLYL